MTALQYTTDYVLKILNCNEFHLEDKLPNRRGNN